ncbi:MAG: hypothetical protein L3J18_03750 [Candidatus Brocadia sp.]|uniref:Uncharacterized protein n=1 Tax=Candidatus Brocadia fulgida TaxID=380242 RepID=A0A0M2UW27_9BACT|nr:MAG: hypothetical protein BROFUL_02583 [Candidatus Brocadia fulgida]UJS21432.1 MAG: hypothetical protein L3J18_03750 [Candidatus Brocadia sp.]
MRTDPGSSGCGKNIGFVNDVCADGICCFTSIPRNQNHLGVTKVFLKRRNASYGIKLLYTALQSKDIVFNPCKCLEFYLRGLITPTGHSIGALLRCGIFGKKYRPYTCNEFPDKPDSFMHDIPAPCIYNEYLAPEDYITLKHKHIFRLYFAIRDDQKFLKKIAPGFTAEEIRKKLNLCENVGKISAIWDEKPAEYFLLEAPKSACVLYTSKVHPKIESIKQAYHLWQGHIESWLERHYGIKWQENLNHAMKQESEKLKGMK